MQLIELSIKQDGTILLTVSCLLFIGGLVVTAIFWLCQIIFRRYLRVSYEINEAEIGVGNSKIKICPNRDDLQIAYKLWVELKTRKLGMQFDENHDVIVEVYNSWYEFFKITRELVKAIPAQKVRSSADTRYLVELAMKVLNDVLRPHLTKWQAKFRRWYDHRIQATDSVQQSPQEIQKQFTEYSELIDDIKRVNSSLVNYAATLEMLIHGKEP